MRYALVDGAGRTLGTTTDRAFAEVWALEMGTVVVPGRVTT